MEKWAKKIEEMTMVQAVIIAALLAGVYYFTSFDSGEGLLNEARGIEKQINQKKALIKETKKRIEEGKKFQVETVKMQKVYKEALEFLPSELSFQDVRRQIVQQAGISSVQVVKVNELPGRTKQNNYEEILFDIEFIGTYKELTSLLANLTKIKKMILSKNIKLTYLRKDEEENLLKLEGQMATYRFEDGA